MKRAGVSHSATYPAEFLATEVNMCLFQERSADEETEVRVRLGNLSVNGYMYIPGVPRVCEKPAERIRKYGSLRSKQGDVTTC